MENARFEQDLTVSTNATSDDDRKKYILEQNPNESFPVSQQQVEIERVDEHVHQGIEESLKCSLTNENSNKNTVNELLEEDDVERARFIKNLNEGAQTTESIIVQNTIVAKNNDKGEVELVESQPVVNILNNTTDGITNLEKRLTCVTSQISTSYNDRHLEPAAETGTSINNTLSEKVQKLDISENNFVRQTESQVIIKNESQSLKNLLVYSDEESDEVNNDSKEINIEKPASRVSDSDSDSDSDSSSDSDDDLNVITSESDDGSSESEVRPPMKGKATSKEVGESTEGLCITHSSLFTDLSKLEVDYEKEVFSHIGEVSAIVVTTVIITAIEGTPVYDQGTILFIDDNDSKKPLGEVSDTFGPVCSPMYSIVFKSAKEIDELGIKTKMKVYSTPNENLSRFVFLKQLLEAKHTDAGTDEESSDTDISESGDERLPQKRKLPENGYGKQSYPWEKTRGSGRKTTQHHNYRNRRIQLNEMNGQHTQMTSGGYHSSFHANSTPFNPSVPPPIYQNYPRWNAHSPTSWSNKGSSNPTNISAPTRTCGTLPNMRVPPPQPDWNSTNPIFNGIPNMPPPNLLPTNMRPPNMPQPIMTPPNLPPPPPIWNNSPRLRFPRNVCPPQTSAWFRWNHPTAAPPCWQPRTRPP